MNDPFETIPDIELIEFCEGLDTPSLLNLSVGSSRVYQICGSEIEKRKQKYLMNIKEIEDIIRNRDFTNFKRYFGNNKSKILTFYGTNNNLVISQTIIPVMGSENVPWILKTRNPDQEYQTPAYDYDEIKRKISAPRDEIITDLAKNLFNQKYQLR